jgi:hypothetical protein
MKTLELTPYGKTIANFQTLQHKLAENKPIPPFTHQASKYSYTIKANPKDNWMINDAPANLTRTEIVIRSLFVFTVPFLADFSDLQFSTHLMYGAIPLMIYLAVTVFTMRDPVKTVLKRN